MNIVEHIKNSLPKKSSTCSRGRFGIIVTMHNGISDRVMIYKRTAESYSICRDHIPRVELQRTHPKATKKNREFLYVAEEAQVSCTVAAECSVRY
jgi:hypothetical protein